MLRGGSQMLKSVLVKYRPRPLQMKRGVTVLNKHGIKILNLVSDKLSVHNIHWNINQWNQKKNKQNKKLHETFHLTFMFWVLTVLGYTTLLACYRSLEMVSVLNSWPFKLEVVVLPLLQILMHKSDFLLTINW